MAAPVEHEQPSLLRGVRNLLLALGALVVGVYFLSRGGNFARVLPPMSRVLAVHTDDDVRLATCGPAPADGRPVVVGFLYSDDKRAWIEEAAERFTKLCPGIQIRMARMGDFEAAEAILSGEIIPTLWSPSDDLILRYVEHRFRLRAATPPFDADRKTPLASSPLVLLVWNSRLQVIDAILPKRPTGGGPWAQVLCAGVPEDPQGVQRMAREHKVPGTWIDWYNPVPPPEPPKRPLPAPRKARAEKPAPVYLRPFPTLDELTRWGRVKIVHTSPTRSIAGLAAIYLMAHDHLLPPGERASAADFERAFAGRREALGRWLERCEAGLHEVPTSATLATDNMFNVGSSRYDGVVTHEHLVFPVLDWIGGSEGTLEEARVLYLQPTILNEHPAVLLERGDVRPEQLAAAERWVAFLRGRDMQQLAITHGFRPVIPEVTIRDTDTLKNPFRLSRRYGVQLDAPLLEPPPIDGKLVHELIRLWEDATGRH